MPTRALTVDDLAIEFGKTRGWMSANWRRLCRDEGLPAPVMDSGHPTWDPPQFYAWKDREVAPELRPVVAAYRAAFDAVASAQTRVSHDEIEERRRELNRKYGVTA